MWLGQFTLWKSEEAKSQIVQLGGFAICVSLLIVLYNYFYEMLAEPMSGQKGNRQAPLVQLQNIRHDTLLRP